VTLGMDFLKTDTNSTLFPDKTKVNLRVGIGHRDNIDSKNNKTKEKQFFTQLELTHHFYINKKNSFFIKNQNYYLKSNTYLTNELFRFGGLYSIRGFTENSLQANFASIIITEYRFLLNKNLYLHSVIDYAIYQDLSILTSVQKINTIKTIGFGLGILTNNGILKLSITNGSNHDNDIKFFNSTVNLCYNVKF
jgi:hemolysin activation/secretion protein